MSQKLRIAITSSAEYRKIIPAFSRLMSPALVPGLNVERSQKILVARGGV